MATEYRASTVLLIINSAMYAVTSIFSRNPITMSERVLTVLGQANNLAVNGAYWQFITSMFVHADIVHFLGNMVFLIYYGRASDLVFSKGQLFVIYFASGLFGNLLTLLLGPFALSVGASGAIFGVIGAYLAYSGGISPNSMGLVLAYSAFFFLFNIGVGVNLFAHFGGLVVGLLIGYALSKRSNSVEL